MRTAKPFPSAGATADLFAEAGLPEARQPPTEPPVPEGFRYTANVLSPAEEADLVRRFAELPFKPYEFRGYSAKRRIHAFGAGYTVGGQQPREDAAIPDYLEPLRHIAAAISGLPATDFAMVMVSEYAPGAGIGWHRDRPQFEDIVGLSFLAPCLFRFRREAGRGWERRAALVEPRSVYLLRGPAREEWQHSIAPMEVLRYSVTLRSLRRKE